MNQHDYMAKIHAGHRVWASKKNRVQAPSRSATRTQTATSSSAPSATPNVNAPSAAAVVAAGVMSLASAHSARRSVKKSVVSLRARGGEEDTRVCIPLEEILGFEQEIATLVFQLSTSLSHSNPNPNLTPTPTKPTFSTGLQLLQCNPRSCETPMWKRSVERVLPWVRWFRSSPMWVCQYQVGWHRPNQTDQRGCFFAFCVGWWNLRLENAFRYMMIYGNDTVLQYTCNNYIPRSTGTDFCISKLRKLWVAKGNWFADADLNHFWRKWLLRKQFFLNSWVYERIIFANWCTKPGWIFINQKGEKTAAFSKKSGGFSTTAFAYKEFLDKGVLETEEKCAEWAVFTVMALVWYKKNRKLDCDFTTILGSRRCSISLQLTNWTLDSESRQVNGLNTSTRRSTEKSYTTCSKRVSGYPPQLFNSKEFRLVIPTKKTVIWRKKTKKHTYD